MNEFTIRFKDKANVTTINHISIGVTGEQCLLSGDTTIRECCSDTVQSVQVNVIHLLCEYNKIQVNDVINWPMFLLVHFDRNNNGASKRFDPLNFFYEMQVNDDCKYELIGAILSKVMSYVKLPIL